MKLFLLIYMALNFMADAQTLPDATVNLETAFAQGYGLRIRITGPGVILPAGQSWVNFGPCTLELHSSSANVRILQRHVDFLQFVPQNSRRLEAHEDRSIKWFSFIENGLNGLNLWETTVAHLNEVCSNSGNFQFEYFPVNTLEGVEEASSQVPQMGTPAAI